MDPQDPLPEPSFCWRRWLTYGAVLINSVLTAGVVWKLDEPRPLMWIALSLILSNIIFALFYMGGASASDLTRILKAASLLKRP